MISVFKKHAPEYKRIVRKFALDVWKNHANRKEFFKKVELFKRKYKLDLIKYYHDEGIKIFPGTITAKANQWAVDQRALADSIEVIAHAKKNKLITSEFDKLRKTKSADVQRMLNKIYLSAEEIKKGSSVYKVFSFRQNFERKAEQLGEESAFELGRDINHAVVGEFSDRYEWASQEDDKVRKTHRKLNGKTFLYSDPPTTVDKYGRRHTGHPGSDFGCRCFEKPSNKKPMRHYVVYEKAA